MHKISNISYNSKQLYRKKKKKKFYALHIYLVNKLPNQSKLVHKHLRKKKNDPTKFALRNAWGIQSILRSLVS